MLSSALESLAKLFLSLSSVVTAGSVVAGFELSIFGTFDSVYVVSGFDSLVVLSVDELSFDSDDVFSVFDSEVELSLVDSVLEELESELDLSVSDFDSVEALSFRLLLNVRLPNPTAFAFAALPHAGNLKFTLERWQ